MASVPLVPSTPQTPRSPSTPRTPGFNTKSPTIKRILQESRELSLSSDPSLTAAPLEANLFEWHFTIKGPPSSPYEQGIYHGRIVLPTTYPLRPPSFRFLTPSGRFEVNREICLSISGHHEETWQPAWGIRTALCAIRAFMASDAKGQIGGIDMNEESRRLLAKQSRSFKCSGCGSRTNGEIMAECEDEWQKSQGDNGHAANHEVVIPDELRLAYKDDMERGPPTPRSTSGQQEASSNLTEMNAHLSLSKDAPEVSARNYMLARGKPPPSPLRATSSATDIGETRGSPHPVSAVGVRQNGASPTIPGTVAPARTEGSSPASSISFRPPQTRSRGATAIPKWIDVAIVVLAFAIVYLAIGKAFA